ncbi:protein kinase, putative [Trypanosoma brucei gambiense DAL972]|uniref:non-specific serine/threonine protein kinase n=1 Tax=Trypanosoma brucei gambiense (strain MHOM/CI/86/DAL972) TaxID=679716 RepID=C9ZRG9_TRYB9|nr:protein kinase, putative [Trypanosoma brucei gambiense DAL972]CBH11999.1 protein kinase, putative [Trypanosoma brucei gambiense DAL972]|eukprot:XP_011774284.1 protein kinase, putative [Trypanosoma brucei gambiense DAL972]
MPRSDRRAKYGKRAQNKITTGGGGAKRKSKPTAPHVEKDGIDINALLEEIERNDSPAEEKVPKETTKKSRRRRKAEKVEGLAVKPGTTVAQARMLASKMQQRHSASTNGPSQPAHQRSEEDEDEDDDDEEQDGSGEDYSDIANERPSEYRKGGYHPVVVGEVYNQRYRVVRKLGWGYFSTVWLVWDYVEKVFQAMKVQKSAKHYTEAAYDEIKLLGEIMTADPEKVRRCARLNDHFEQQGPNGKHVCMVFDVYGEDLLSLIERYKYHGVPLPIVKCISRQILIGLEHVHSLDIIHTDLKPENVLLSAPKHAIVSQMKRFKPPPLHDRPSLVKRDPKTMTKSQRRRYYKKLRAAGKGKDSAEGNEEQNDDEDIAREVHVDPNEAAPQQSEKEPLSETDSEWEVERLHHVVLADFGNSCWTYRQFTDEVQTRQYRSPEVILGYPYSTSIDLWSAACMIFELITGEFLFDPRKGSDYSRDEDHLALISELLGVLPVSMRLGDGKYRAQYYNSRGELRSIKDLNFWGLEDVLYRKHKFTRKKAKEIAEFLLPMLELEPHNRATATDMLNNFQHFFEVQEDDYAPLCFVPSSDDHRGGERSSANMEESEFSDTFEETDDYDRSRRLDRTYDAMEDSLSRQDEEAARYLAGHSLLNEASLAKRGLTILDIQAVLSGQQLEDEERQAAATEIIRLLSEEADDSSDGHCADREDGDSNSSVDESDSSCTND